MAEMTKLLDRVTAAPHTKRHVSSAFTYTAFALFVSSHLEHVNMNVVC